MHSHLFPLGIILPGLLFWTTIAHAQGAEAPDSNSPLITINQPVRPLPGQLDRIPVFNSNSPEVVQQEGILLSTMNPQGRSHGAAHLNHVFTGRFDVFTHHISRPSLPPLEAGRRRLNLGVLVYNPGQEPVQLDILQSLSYTSNQADAPFQTLPAYVYNPEGKVFSGPGSRLATDWLLGKSEAPRKLTILPGQSQVVFNRPIPDSSARSSLMSLRSSGGVQVASIALLDRPDTPPEIIGAPGHVTALPPGEPQEPLERPAAPPLPRYRSPQLADWQGALNELPLATPRDLAPSPPNRAGAIIYGRVAGVSVGTRWEAMVTDEPSQSYLSIPDRGQGVSYVLNTLFFGTLGTGQVQTAPLKVRYPDTSYEAHGNYTTYYRLTMPLRNNTGAEQVVALKLQTPIKGQWERNQLRFYRQPPERIFFRGTLRVTVTNNQGEVINSRPIHVVQRQGEMGKPLVALRLPPGQVQTVELDLVYPPDATPPQVVTLTSIDPTDGFHVPAERVLPLVEVPTP